MKILFDMLVLSGTMKVLAKTEIKIEELLNHEGDSLKLSTKIYRAILVFTIPGKPRY